MKKKTCKNRDHYDVCYELMTQLHWKPELCRSFKDKSLIVELPCKVGDVVYYIANIERTSRLLPFINEYAVCEIRHSKRKIYFDLCNKKDVDKNKKIYHTTSLDKFGKNWFTDKAKAEEMLKNNIRSIK